MNGYRGSTNTMTTLAVASLAILGGIGGVHQYLARRRQRKEDERLAATGAYVSVTDLEHQLASLGTAPISTLTWMKGDLTKASQCFEHRVREVCKANPWLFGKLAKKDGRVHIWVPNDGIESGGIFSQGTTKDSPIHYEMTPVELSKIVQREGTRQGFILAMGKDFDQVFWKVSLVPCNRCPTERFALICSMSHIIGDGHTFYSLHNMLLGSEPVASLEVTRVSNTTTLQEEMLGKAESAVMYSWGLIVVALRGVFQSNVLSKIPRTGAALRPAAKYFLVDAQKISELKQDYANISTKQEDDRTPFVSTNDIITSWFLSQTGCDHGLMAVNLRGRLKDHSLNLAGNYENCVYYRVPKDTESPALIRKSVATLRRSVSAKAPFSNKDMAFSSGFSLVTNWASFAKMTVHLNHSAGKADDSFTTKEQKGDDLVTLLHHLPIYDVEALIPSTMNMCLIFQYRPEQLAVVLAARPDRMANLVPAPFELTGRCL